MTWGNVTALMQMMKKIAYRDGVGDIFAEGIVKAASHFGSEAEVCVSHCKGPWALPPPHAARIICAVWCLLNLSGLQK